MNVTLLSRDPGVIVGRLCRDDHVIGALLLLELRTMYKRPVLKVIAHDRIRSTLQGASRSIEELPG